MLFLGNAVGLYVPLAEKSCDVANIWCSVFEIPATPTTNDPANSLDTYYSSFCLFSYDTLLVGYRLF
jgi:hypothetical protein